MMDIKSTERQRGDGRARRLTDINEAKGLTNIYSEFLEEENGAGLNKERKAENFPEQTKDINPLLWKAQ